MAEYTSPVLEEVVYEVASLEDAKTQACALWGVPSEDICSEVLDEGKRLFGLFGKKMRVRVTPTAPLPLLRAQQFVSDLLGLMQLEATPEREGADTLNLVGEDSGIIIGRYGETLKALELLTNLVIREPQSSWKIRFDCCGYRARREDTLMRLAESFARDAIKKRCSITLEPMPSWERRIIHLALQDNQEVETHSVGDDPMRKVVITPTKRK